MIRFSTGVRFSREGQGGSEKHYLNSFTRLHVSSIMWLLQQLLEISSLGNN